MEKLILKVTEGVYATAKDARKADRVPMVYYGKNIANRGFSIDYQDFRRAYKKGGKSTIMYLNNEKDEEFPVIVQSIQYDPVTDQMMHVDLIAVDMNKSIRTKIPVVLVGISPAVKDLAGILVQNKNNIEVECLAKDLIQNIEVDISSLTDFHSSITVGDIKVPDTIKVLDAEDINVATVTAPRSTAEEEDAAAAKVATEAATASAGSSAEAKTDESAEKGAKKEK